MDWGYGVYPVRLSAAFWRQLSVIFFMAVLVPGHVVWNCLSFALQASDLGWRQVSPRFSSALPGPRLSL